MTFTSFLKCILKTLLSPIIQVFTFNSVYLSNIFSTQGVMNTLTYKVGSFTIKNIIPIEDMYE